MDWWGDAAQIAGAIGGLGTVGVAFYGAKLWKATDRLAVQTAMANDLVAEAAWLDAHERLRPKFNAVLAPVSIKSARLMLTLKGPDALDRLDELEVSVRNDSPTRIEWHQSAGEKAIASQWIFSPWQFKESSDGGRSSELVIPFEKAEQYTWPLVATHDPRPQPESVDDWLSEMKRTPFKIKITSTLRSEHKPHVWTNLVTPRVMPSPPPRLGEAGAD